MQPDGSEIVRTKVGSHAPVIEKLEPPSEEERERLDPFSSRERFSKVTPEEAIEWGPNDWREAYRKFPGLADDLWAGVLTRAENAEV